jgi:hypothetical protein
MMFGASKIIQAWPLFAFPLSTLIQINSLIFVLIH